MHEFSLVSDLLETVMESAGQNGIRNVTRVKLIVGECHGALPEALSFAFKALSGDTVCSGAELEIEIKKGILLCTACGHEFSYEILQNMCPRCGSFYLDIVSGRELRIDYFEGE
ncbi:MAG: hydrogenase maturation nickel metallochaperone HypA [Bacillota bacterium]